MSHKMGINKMEMIYVTAVQLIISARAQNKEEVTDSMNLLLDLVDDGDVKAAQALCIKDSLKCDCEDCQEIRKQLNL